MRFNKIILFFCLFVTACFSSINEYFPTLAEYKAIGDNAYNRIKKQPRIKGYYVEAASSVNGLIAYLKSSLKHNEIDEEELERQFELLKLKLTPLFQSLNIQSEPNQEQADIKKEKTGSLRVDSMSGMKASISNSLITVTADDPLGLKKMMEEISKYFNKLHKEKIEANEEDIKQLDQYKWKE